MNTQARSERKVKNRMDTHKKGGFVVVFVVWGVVARAQRSEDLLGKGKHTKHDETPWGNRGKGDDGKEITEKQNRGTEILYQ